MLTNETTAIIDVVVGRGAVGALGSQAVCVVSVRPGGIHKVLSR